MCTFTSTSMDLTNQPQHYQQAKGEYIRITVKYPPARQYPSSPFQPAVLP